MARQLAIAFIIVLAILDAAPAQLLSFPDPSLDYVFPAGGQRGQTVTVDCGGTGGLTGASRVLVEGPPGIKVESVKSVSPSLVQATLTIAADAAPGRRWLRVLGGANGLTNARPFFVSTLPEVVEKGNNDTPAAAQEVTLPVVINGQIEKDLDVDCFRFAAKSGQKLIAALFAHGMDSTVRVSFNQGYVDASLEVLDEQGKILAAADDTLGLDPVLEHTFQADGRFVVRVQTLSHKGSLSSAYRLTLGDVPIPAAIFPAGGRRGATIAAAWHGYNLPAKQPVSKLTIATEGRFPFQFVLPPFPISDGRDVLVVRGAHPESIEQEPNDDAKRATSLAVPQCVQGRFDQPGDEDWFRISLKKDQGVVFDVMAQRHLRSPVDTLLEVYDAAGKKLTENDDGRPVQRPNQCDHDFSSADSWLSWTAPADGVYFIRLRDVNGSGGPTAIYRLTVTLAQPDFKLFQWPDAVPIWGPGNTSAFIVELMHWDGWKDDIELSVAGLPPGWTGSSSKLSASMFSIYAAPNATRALLTITAPSDAPLGAVAEFHVVGKATVAGQSIERFAQPLSLYGNSHNDGMLLRFSLVSRAVVAQQLDCRLETSIKEVTGTPGATIQIPVRIHRKADSKGAMGLVVNGPTVAANNGLGPPRTITPEQSEVILPLTIDLQTPLGTRGVVVARSWVSDIRGGRPGPCTPIILLHVLPKQPVSAK